MEIDLTTCILTTLKNFCLQHSVQRVSVWTRKSEEIYCVFGCHTETPDLKPLGEFRVKISKISWEMDQKVLRTSQELVIFEPNKESEKIPTCSIITPSPRSEGGF